MAQRAAILAMDHSDDESEVGSDFEIDDAIKQDLDNLLNIPLEFEEDSCDEKEESQQGITSLEKIRGDSVERQLEALFVEEKDDPGGGNGKEPTNGKDTGLENISDNEFDGPESGECDTSDGELPDSPSIVVTLPDTPPVLPSMIQGVDDVSIDGESDVELLEEYQSRNREYYDTVNQKICVPKTDREVILERPEPDKPKSKEKKEKDLGKVKSADRSKSKEKKDKNKKKVDSSDISEDLKRKLKLKKYLSRLDQYRAKCLEYMTQITQKCDIIKKDEKNKIKEGSGKIRTLKKSDEKLKSVVEKVVKEPSPLSSHSSKQDKATHTITVDESPKRKRLSSEKERKSKSDKKKTKSRELKEHKMKYQRYIQYLQSEREKCYEERLALDKHKTKSKRKHRRSKSTSPEKLKEKPPVLVKKEIRPPVLSFAEFCNSRELASPEKELLIKSVEQQTSDNSEGKKERTISVDSLATTSTAQSDLHHDDDKELFPTYSEIVEQDKIKENKKLEEDRGKIEDILEKDPELKSISVFTSVLFKGSADSNGIPFLQEGGRSPSPKAEPLKPKPTFTQSTGPDELYDWNDDLSTISQSSLSPSRSPAPKVHNKALLNFLENQKDRPEKRKIKSKKSKSSRSRSKSPKKDILKTKKRKSKHTSSVSVSPSPPPLKPRSPECKKRPSPPAYLKERWKDYPSPPERRREHYERPRSRRRSRSRTRSRVSHRSRSSSEERHYRRYRSRSRSRSRSPPTLTMVQLTTTEKRRKLKEEHERALASLRATIRKPMATTPLSITFTTTDGDNYESVRDNYDPVVMNEVQPPHSRTALSSNGYSYSHHPGCRDPYFPFAVTPQYCYYPSYYYY